MNSRERIRKALNLEEPDRVPIDFGQDFHNGINEVAYTNLLSHLGINDAGPVKVWDPMQRLAVVDQRVLERFHVDTRYIFARKNKHFDLHFEPDGSFEDEWGVYRKRCGYYCDSVRGPLTEMTKQQIKQHRFPDPSEKSRFQGLRQEAENLYNNTDYALMAGQAATLFYFSSELRGYQQLMTDLALDPELIEILIERVLEWMIEFTSHYLDQIGDYIEGWWLGDDWGIQTGPIMSPEMFRKFFKPRYRRLFDLVRSKTKAKIILHTCGATYWLLKDLIDLGIDAVHPLQPTAAGNEDSERIKKEFGKKIAFYSNIANTTILPYGTVAETIAEVEKKISIMAPGGGYIFSGGHNIQADVPAENIVAMFDTAYEVGQYPIEARV